MLSIANPISAGRGDYYVNLAQEDYYKAEEAGNWFGKGAAELGLSGRVSPESFRNLLQGYDHSGMTPWVQNAGKPSRQQGWDLTFSAPKDVSVLWALSDKAVQKEIEAAQKKAVEKALTHIEAKAGIARRGKGGSKKEKTNLVFARFEHFTSRSLDPQIHTHAVLLNVTLRRDKTTGTIQSKNVFQTKMQGGLLYREALAVELKHRLNLEITPKEVGFRLPIVPAALSEAFSKRRLAIIQSMLERNENGPLAAKKAALRTRKRKEEISRAELFSAWKKVGDEFGFKSPVHAPAEKHEENRPREKKEENFGPRIEPWDGKRHWNDWASKSQVVATGSHSERARSPKIGSFVRIESRYLFPHAPSWSAARRLKLPRIVVGSPREKVWGRIRSKRNLLFADLIVQERKLFPGAPKWNPLSRVTLPVLRVKPKPLIKKWLPEFDLKKISAARRDQRTRKKAAEKTNENKGQTHSR